MYNERMRFLADARNDRSLVVGRGMKWRFDNIFVFMKIFHRIATSFPSMIPINPVILSVSEGSPAYVMTKIFKNGILI